MKRLEELWFRYFSEATIDDKQYGWVRYLVAMALAIPAVLGVISDSMELQALARVCFLVFLGFFIVFAGLWIIVWFYHNNKERKNG